jgi:hypothetical protein
MANQAFLMTILRVTVRVTDKLMQTSCLAKQADFTPDGLEGHEWL